jgi:hypothetical protein
VEAIEASDPLNNGGARPSNVTDSSTVALSLPDRHRRRSFAVVERETYLQLAVVVLPARSVAVTEASPPPT